MRTLLAALCALALAAPAYAAKPSPSGSFTVGSSYTVGDTASFTFGDIRNVTNSYEVTLGVWCDPGIQWGNRGNPYIYEFNSFGDVFDFYTVYLYLPAPGSCTARLISAYWFKGNPVEAWTLDEHPFTVN